MGTTLIECKRLGRAGLGVEIDPGVAERSLERINTAENPYNVPVAVLVGDSTTTLTAKRVRATLKEWGGAAADCIILHPPYHDIIRSANAMATCRACQQRPLFWTRSVWSRGTRMSC